MIPKRSLGNTNIEVSCLGLGTVKFGRNQNVKYPEGFDLPNDKEISDLIKKAEELGFNLLDTAPAYGSSEQRIGELFQKKKISRHDWVISTKVGEQFENGKSNFDFSATTTELSIKRSLKRLKTDYLDIVLIHSNGFDEEILDKTDCCLLYKN
jgi:aryl-alcohol dehydrogenase-like predicted oxidoreductase